MSLETQLRDALAARADELDGPAFDPYERVTGAVVTSRRRRRGAAIGAVAAVAAVAVLVPGLSQGDRRSTLPAKRTQVIVPGPSDPRWAAMSSWPVRGSLAEDKAFISAVTEKSLTAHVVYAADLDRTRVVVGWDPEDGGSTRVSMFAGPLGAGADELAGVSVWSGDATDVVVLRESDDPDSRVVALTTPGNRTLELSTGVQIGIDGTVTRDAYRPITLTDGAWSNVVHDSPPSLMRIHPSGGAVADTPATLTGPPVTQREDLGSVCLNCTGEDFRAKAEDAMGAGVAVRLGLEPKDVRSTTRFFGAADPQVVEHADFGAKGPVTNEVIVVDSTLPGGQVLRSAMVVVRAKDSSESMASDSASGVPIDAATAADRPFVLHGAIDGNRVTHEVFAPTAASVRLVSSGSLAYPSSAVVPVRNGTALVTTPTTDPSIASYEVVTYDADGAQIGRWPLDLPSDDVWTAGTTR
ncbi:hypothetical protein [Phycicoccus sp. Root101]|uniref:hypothetical protein n=1 Tax=Phycicoccus sp. Root101 TaxID=1736421 RepID=UPI0007035C38|nr:hypothetical protein [Phycicoccus sp. Root101]KQU67450.1 hypothetical protein ASC58_12855 [Phycicoccus sp. Root101]